jgi:hypothetical protein
MEEWQLSEFRKCASDFGHFCRNYVKILHPARGLVNFKLYEFQERVIGDFCKYPYNIVSKFRQAGLTTVAVVYGLWLSMFNLDQRILVLSKSDREAIGVGKIVSQIIENLPDWLRPVMGNNNDHEKEFKETNGTMWFYTCEAARSKAITFLIIDEAAFIKGMDEYWKGIFPVLSAGGRCAVISTVNGIGNWYEETFHRAQDKKNQFHVIELDYREHPDYNNPEWEKKMRSNLGDKGWVQEILRQFLGSGDTYIPMEVLQHLEKQIVPPLRKRFEQWDSKPSEEFKVEELANAEYEPGALWIWEDPQEGQEYMISADCSVGMGGDGDSNVFHVFNMSTFEQVAEFESNIIKTFEFAQVLAQTGVFYNECLIVCENDTGPGLAVLDRLFHNLRYPNLYFTQSGKQDKPGISLGRTNRPVCLETMRTCLANRLFGVKSARLLRELNTFVFDRQSQKPKASHGKHDDLVLALAIGLHVTDMVNRNSPVITKEASRDILSDAIKGQSLDDIRQELEKGFSEDYWDVYEDVDEMLPKITSSESLKFRPQEALLREFRF